MKEDPTSTVASTLETKASADLTAQVSKELQQPDPTSEEAKAILESSDGDA